MVPTTSMAPVPLSEPVLTLIKVEFDELPGWGIGKERQAFRAFLKSCKKLINLPPAELVIDPERGLVSRIAGRGHHWGEVCGKAQHVLPKLSLINAVRFFEKWFVRI